MGSVAAYGKARAMIISGLVVNYTIPNLNVIPITSPQIGQIERAANFIVPGQDGENQRVGQPGISRIIGYLYRNLKVVRNGVSDCNAVYSSVLFTNS